MRFASAPIALLVVCLAAGCTPKRIPGLDIELEDTPDNRALLQVVDAYRTAYENKDIDGLVALASSRFGLRRTFNGKLQSRHLGLDIDGSLGRPVRAIGAGRVVLVAQRYYSGLTVVIDHGLRLFSMYYHLSAAEVEPGQRVSKGQRIGRVGRSGRVTGPHLHLSFKVEGENIDPLSLFGFDFDAGPEAGSPAR